MPLNWILNIQLLRKLNIEWESILPGTNYSWKLTNWIHVLSQHESVNKEYSMGRAREKKRKM